MTTNKYVSEKLGQVVSFRTGKLNSNAAKMDGMYPFFTCSQETFKTDTYSFDTECVLLAGNNANGIYPLKYFNGKFDAYQRTYVIEPLNRKDLSARFLYYALRPTLELLRSISTGAATKFLTLPILRDIVIPVPKLSIQQRIAAVLSAYDDLIENNTRRIQILEEMARRIYEEWFVRFRFPGHENVRMVESELGLIPAGWEVKKLGLLIKRLAAGNTYRNSDISSNGDVIVVDQSTSEHLGFHNNQPDHHADREHPIIIFGDHTCKLQVMVTPFSIGANTVPFVGNDETSVYYLYNLISGLVTTEEYKRHWTELNNKTVIKASSKLCVQYDVLVKPFFAGMDVLRRKNRSLRRTRDLLLPKLISGEIDVSHFPGPE